MTTKPASRKTLSDLFPLISQADISEKAKADMASAVRKIAKVLGTDPALLPIDPQNLRRRLEGISCQLAGVNQGRWNNIRSLFGKALALATPILPGRSYMQLTPDWQALGDRLGFGRRTKLLPMLRRFSELGIEPGRLALADLEAYRIAICEDRLRSNPESTWDTLVWSWNACVREITDWPQITIPREAKLDALVLQNVKDQLLVPERLTVVLEALMEQRSQKDQAVADRRKSLEGELREKRTNSLVSTAPSKKAWSILTQT